MSTINKQLGTFKDHPTSTVTWVAVEWNGSNYLAAYADANPEELSALEGLDDDDDHRVRDGETIKQALARCMSKIEALRNEAAEDGYIWQE